MWGIAILSFKSIFKFETCYNKKVETKMKIEHSKTAITSVLIKCLKKKKEEKIQVN